MKIVVDAVGVRDGGGAHLFNLLLKNLCGSRRNWSWIFLVSTDDLRDFELVDIPKNAEVTRIGSTLGWLGRFGWLNVRLPRILHVNNADMLFCFANLSPIFPSVPTILFLQQIKILENSSVRWTKDWLRFRLMRSYVWLAAGNVRKVVVQNREMQRLLCECITSTCGRIEVIPAAVNVAEKKVLPDPLMDRLDQASAPRFAYVSVARSHKNHVRLIRAFSRIRQQHPAATLLLTIPSPDSTEMAADPCVAEVHEEAERESVTNAIVWLGILHPAQVSTVYSYADAVIFPSLRESFGMPLAEALCARLPVVASDLEYAHEILGGDADYFDPEDIEDIVTVVLRFLRRPKREPLPTSLNEERCAIFRPQSVAERFCQLFEHTLEEKLR